MKTDLKTDKAILTFGYGNRSNYDDLIAHIENHHVAYVIDVRLKPRAWTRKWYGDRIENLCQSQGIEYKSIADLGNTSGTKEWIPVDHDAANQALKKVAELAESKTVLLLCAEKDFHRCHRTEVAERLQELVNLPINHLA
jgi:uncharacterized protein (DUF488 family)